jgi:hypothetical protein
LKMMKTTKPRKTASKPKTHKVGASKKGLGAKKTGGKGADKAEKQGKTPVPEKQEKHAGGRPSDKTPELLKRICDGISIGKSARAMCLEVEIAQSTLWKWLNESEEFSKQYARAKEDCADYLAAEIVEIADDGSRDYVQDKDGRDVPDHDHIARSRLRVDARKWYASKLAPKKYGDKLDMNHGVQPDNPLADLMGKIIGSADGRIRPAS